MSNDNALAQFAYYGIPTPQDEALSDLTPSDCDLILSSLRQTERQLKQGLILDKAGRMRLQQVKSVKAKIANLKGLL